MAVYDEGFAPSAGTPRFSNLMNYAGATLSLALIFGVGVWGYDLIVRDVSGIPVVRAMEGEMRVLPENPGGALALHTGLSVNEVAASGEAGGLEDMLVLAPRTSGLAQEDLEAQPVPASPATIVEEAAAPIEPATDAIALLTAQLTEGIAAPIMETIPASVPGVVASLRPLARPGGSEQASIVHASLVQATIDASEVAVNTADFAAGTNLVQLGAYPNPSMAAAAWTNLQARFGSLMAGRDRVIQVSNQSSGTWYRLRASGFADRADARRLCAALQAEGTDCIAVVIN